MGLSSMSLNLCGIKTPSVRLRNSPCTSTLILSTHDVMLAIDVDSTEDLLALGERIVEAAKSALPKEDALTGLEEVAV